MSDLAICLATYNPNLLYFQKQINSIISQTYKSWQCIISDQSPDPQIQKQIKAIISADPRFIYIDNSLKQNGLVYNFENSILNLPHDIQFISFCDQDDVWDPSKIQKQINLLKNDPEIGIVHSDLRLIDQEDRTLFESCWKYEQRNLSQVNDFKELAVRNQITGCSMMFRSSLLSLALPFPSFLNHYYLHDHWMSICCLAMGLKIQNLNEALINYRQHGQNQVGAASRGFKLTSLKIMREKTKALFLTRKKVFHELLNRLKQINKSSNFEKDLSELNSKKFYLIRLLTQSKNFSTFKFNILLFIGCINEFKSH